MGFSNKHYHPTPNMFLITKVKIFMTVNGDDHSKKFDREVFQPDDVRTGYLYLPIMSFFPLN